MKKASKLISDCALTTGTQGSTLLSISSYSNFGKSGRSSSRRSRNCFSVLVNIKIEKQKPNRGKFSTSRKLHIVPDTVGTFRREKLGKSNDLTLISRPLFEAGRCSLNTVQRLAPYRDNRLARLTCLQFVSHNSSRSGLLASWSEETGLAEAASTVFC